MTFPLTIVSPRGLIFDGEVNFCYVPTSCGPVGILPGHTPIVARIDEKGGILRYEETNGILHIYAIRSGALEVKREKTILLVENIKKADSIEQAKELLKEDTLNETKPTSEQDVKLAQGLSQKNI